MGMRGWGSFRNRVQRGGRWGEQVKRNSSGTREGTVYGIQVRKGTKKGKGRFSR